MNNTEGLTMISNLRVKQVDIDGIHQNIDWLMYRSYEFNRNRAPHIKPESWRKIYYNADVYEKIYDKNRSKK